ncbi:tetratricopeptide repeat protein [Micromonospora sp. STR1_7]|uniref:Tetratricopeptide repeat protein n=1 Tax=Micromonospora parastrephiae TaxID=2806101 RepID=A0ABS1XU38_9ACTN|nr:tetratricopeptide repeat protein [Micromonospora parastrephiae]MBM0232782.1 tetratricopeptide repeat protein [Micromonospora parastrephiae]
MADNRPGPRRVSADRTGTIRVDAGGSSVAVSGVVLGSITIGDTTYVLDDIATAPAALPRDPVETPSRLLATHQRAVAFTGREQELDALVRWRDAPNIPWAVRLIHGAGGEGKTRLALRIAELSVGQGWRVVEARHRSSIAPPEGIAAEAARGDRLLVVVDYAERWPAEHLLGVLGDPLVRRHGQVRILLISRQAGAWWQAIRHELKKITGDVDVIRLQHLAPGRQREAAFVAARDEFARIFDVEAADIPLPANLSGPEFDLVLSVHMAALVAVHTRKTGASAPTGTAGLSTYLLEREQAAWHALHRRGVVATAPAVLAQTVATAILTRALPVKAAIAALGTARVAEPVGAGQVLDDHSICYPSAHQGVVLEPLYPDRLAEDFLALTLPGHHHEDFHIPPSVGHWAGTLVETVLSPQAPWLREGLTVVIETAHRWPHVAKHHLFPLLRQQPALAVAAGAAAVIRVVELRDIDIGVLAAVARELPTRRHVELDSAAAAVSERLAEMMLAQTTDRATKMTVLAELGSRLANAGHLQRALEVSTRAVRLCVLLDEQHPDGVHGVLAAPVYALQGLMLLNLGRAADALEPMRTAVARYRVLVRRDRRLLAGMAGALSNLALSYSRVGRSREALSTHLEALRIRRRLHRRGPTGMADELAISLSNVANEFMSTGRVAEALPVALEALVLRRDLAREAPATYLVDLAISLNNLVPIYLALDRVDEAFEHARQVVEIRRQLVQANATAFEPALASALSNLAGLQLRYGQVAEASLTMSQAVDVYRRLARADPAAHALEQVNATSQLADLLLRTGRPAQARDLAAEALALTGHVAQVAPGRLRSEQVAATTCLFRALWDLEEADEAKQLVTQLLEQAATWDADARVALRVDLLNRQLSARDLDAVALTAAETAVRLFRSASRNEPVNLDFAEALLNLGIRLRGVGRLAEARTVLREAATLVDGPEPVGRHRLIAVKVATLRGITALESVDVQTAVDSAARAAALGRTIALPAGTADTLTQLLDGLQQLFTAVDDAEATVVAGRLRGDAAAIRSAQRVPDEEEFRFSIL